MANPTSSRSISNLLAALLVLTTAFTAEAANRRRDRDELIVAFRAGVSSARMEAILRSQGAATVEEIGAIRARVVRVPEPAVDSTANALARRTEVEFVERNRRVAPEATANDPSYASQWHLPKIGAAAAWDVSRGDSSLQIAILDTGVDAAHPDLADRVVAGWNFHDGNADSSDVHGHGTKVAGAAAAATNNGIGVAGVAWDALILPIRISDPSGYAYYSTIAQGITWASDRGARVMNVSFNGVSASLAIQNAAKYARDRGGYVVVAAGNCGCDDPTAETPYLLSVGATDANDGPASFTSRGSYVDVAAPGVSILTTVRGGGYGNASGTSFASPVTAGLVALLFAANPALGADQIDELIESTAVDLGAAGHDTSFGFGRIDAHRALLAAVESAPPPPDATAPSVSITSPDSGASVSGTVGVSIVAFDDVGVASVDLRVDGVVVATDSTAPFEFAWNSVTVTNGSHVLRAVARDAAGNSGASADVVVTVSNSTTKPTKRGGGGPKKR